MGVWGLKTFICNHKTNFFTDFKLKNTKLIIDGTNLLYFLHLHYENKSVYGGNYDHFYEACTDFFKTLLKCNVTPIVVFDGADDKSNMKLNTIKKRLNKQFEKVKKLEKMEELLPVLSKITLCQVLVDLNIVHLACIYEADREIAVLANKWDCPVLSDDSDFCVYNLKKGNISMDSLFESVRTGIARKRYLPVKLYTCFIFLHELFKMENDEFMLPVFATLVGNDYFDPSMTLASPKNPQDKLHCKKGRIRRVVEWLLRAGFESGRTALEQISSQITDYRREQFEVSVNSYRDIDTFLFFDLDAYLRKKYSDNSALLSNNDTKTYEQKILNKQNHAVDSNIEHCTKTNDHDGVILQSADNDVIDSTCLSRKKESFDKSQRVNVTSNQNEQYEFKDETFDVSKANEKKQYYSDDKSITNCTRHQLDANCSSTKLYTTEIHQVNVAGNRSGYFVMPEQQAQKDVKTEKCRTAYLDRQYIQCSAEDNHAQLNDGNATQSKTDDQQEYDVKGTSICKVIYKRESLDNNVLIQSVDKFIDSTCISEQQNCLEGVHMVSLASNKHVTEHLEYKDRSADESKPEDIIFRDRTGRHLPVWFVQNSVECKMDCSFLLNITQNYRLIFKAQAERIELDSSFQCSEKIRRVIYSLVLDHNFKPKKRRKKIKEYHRHSSKRIRVKPIKTIDGISELPRLEIISDLPESERMAIMGGTFGASSISFNEDKDTSSQIVIFMLSLWKKNSNAPADHLNALIIGMIALHIFSPTVPRQRQCPDILEAIRSTDKKTTEKFRKCMGENFLTHVDLHRRDINTRKFIHNVSQFQAVYLHTFYLNQLLLSPVCIPSPSVILNSTFACNMCHLLENNVKPKNILCGEGSPLYRLFTKWKNAVGQICQTRISSGRYGIIYDKEGNIL